jgi:hypothetical protein
MNKRSTAKTMPAANRDNRRSLLAAGRENSSDELRAQNRTCYISSFQIHPSNVTPTLATLRETLLPKLLSGELAVAAALRESMLATVSVASSQVAWTGWTQWTHRRN